MFSSGVPVGGNKVTLFQGWPSFGEFVNVDVQCLGGSKREWGIPRLLSVEEGVRKVVVCKCLFLT